MVALDAAAHDARVNWVSGLKGTSQSEALVLAMVYPASLWFYEHVRAVLLPGWMANESVATAVEFAVTVLPLVAAYTVLSHVAAWMVVGFALLPMLALLSGAARLHRSAPAAAETPVDGGGRQRRQQPAFLSAWRSALLLTTCVCILGVDFNAFPRRFGKTETFGVSPMDGGVGGFVLSAGLVAPHARAALSGGGVQARGGGGWSATVRRAKRVLLLLVLGVARLLSTRAVNYQHHVSEYGAHWNFFFTLAAIQIMSLSIPVATCISNGRSWISIPLCVGACLAITYQTLLTHGGLSAAVLSETRGPSFVEQNREGLSSTAGLLALFWIGVGMGQRIYRRESSTAEAARELFVASLVSGAVAWAAGTYIERPSRRLANLAYIAWVLEVALLLMLALLGVEALRGANVAPPRLAAAASKWSLQLFLFANILTGACNLSIDTISVGDDAAFVVLSLYAAALALLLAHINRAWEKAGAVLLSACGQGF